MMVVSKDGEYGLIVQPQETYLGDGLYVSLEPNVGIRLRAPRLGGDHEVFLEPAVYEAFLMWLAGQGISTEPPA